MAHYAKLAANNKVIGVHVVADADCQNASGVEDEEVGRQFLERIHSWPFWKKTSYNTSGGTHKDGGTALRGNYAGIGMTYDEDNDIFIGKKPYASWVLNTTTASWHSPIGDAPDDLTDEEKAAFTSYVWNEGTGAWDKTTPEA